MFDEIEKKEDDLDKIADENKSSQNIKNDNKKDSGKENISEPSLVEKEELEDIFSGTADDVADSSENETFYNQGKKKPDVFSPVEEKTEAEDASSEEHLPLAKIAIFLILILVFIFGSYFAYSRYFKNFISSDNEEVMVEDETPDETPNGNQDEEPIENKQNVEKEASDSENTEEAIEEKDTDGDGLSDSFEKELGTSIFNIDTDGDGLFDREEVIVYKTDPNNKDTDGDGFFDGNEVDAGYNPNGDGKLYDINQ